VTEGITDVVWFDAPLGISVALVFVACEQNGAITPAWPWKNPDQQRAWHSGHQGEDQ
jgi:hypothetical protein